MAALGRPGPPELPTPVFTDYLPSVPNAQDEVLACSV